MGGDEASIIKYKKKIKKEEQKSIIFMGRKKHAEIPFYLKMADVLVLPNTAKERISNLHTSPIKLFEYMASGKPIIASSIPSIRQVVTDKEVKFFEADNEADLANKLKLLLSDDFNLAELTLNAKMKANDFDWKKRAEKIIKLAIN